MTTVNYMAVGYGKAFQRRVHFAMFDEGKDILGGTPTANQTAYIQGIVNGQAPVLEMSIGVLMNAAVKTSIDADPTGNSITDAEIKTAVSAVFTIYSDAWAVR